jgi:pyruvate-ferredoxin/flavodoxin oxidoreductase
MAVQQAIAVKDSRGMPEFVFHPELGESYADAIQLRGNKSHDRDWIPKAVRNTKEKYNYTPAQWCATEARFRNHLKKIKPTDTVEMVHLDEILVRLTQRDVIERRYLDKSHRAFVPDFGVYMVTEDRKGEPVYYKLSRQMVLFCVERRKAWRLLQSKAGVTNKDYAAQRRLLAKVDKGEVPLSELLEKGRKLLAAELAAK